jgi:hypothetical protein
MPSVSILYFFRTFDAGVDHLGLRDQMELPLGSTENVVPIH